jgi:hypothetical protein
MANLNFVSDLPLGQKGETNIANHLSETYGYAIKSFNHNNTHDFIMDVNGVDKTVEVKTDVYCIPPTKITLPSGASFNVEGRDTGNIFIETECRGKLSGINTTKSDIFVYYYPLLKQAWVIQTKKLKKLVESNDLELKENAGDENSNTKGYVIPRNKFISEFKVMDINIEWETQN